ncbi:phosphotransferase [Mycobacterium sp. KBS0706]|uniref:phosphotransferase family protein n=1 Tax=Mycobacterium sp. KBS0706 TaxID=2578109 RepID=UPI00110FB079|nr:phosphotransferase [Mycobacterium sp. KBS0706]TSD85898.1 phosphotransferase [Mycobacterium sp. KBS0706]
MEGPLARLLQHVLPGARLRAARPLAGGVSAEVTALEVVHPDGRAETLVLRRHGAADLARDPDIAAHEFRLLQLLQAAGVPAPLPLYLDESGTILPTPFLLQSFVDGDTEDVPADLDDHMRQLAGALAAIHRVPASEVPFLPLQEEQAAALIAQPRPELDESLAESRLRTALAASWPPPRRNPPVLLHGDVWPGNLLWRGGRLQAMVDWEDAAIGDPLADLANARLELFIALGENAMAALTRHYLAISAIDTAALPLWDLWAALRPIAGLPGWGLEPEVEHRLRERHRAFTARALAAEASPTSGPAAAAPARL